MRVFPSIIFHRSTTCNPVRIQTVRGGNTIATHPMKFLAALQFAFCSLSMAVRAADGIFADFVTSMGSFTAELHYTVAPRTAANFISLAEGSRAWVDPQTSSVAFGKPFYNGLIFHRVIKGFMNQGGCPLGTGNSGPGYQFRDEFSQSLLHNLPYRLSMANIGYHTNGSQFFVTVATTPHLDLKHSVFGTVVQGQNVVDLINAVPTSGSPNDRPLTPVVIQTVTIRRVGTAAQAFDVTAQGLPVCSGSRGKLSVQRNVATNWLLDLPMGTGDIIKASRSADLKSWNSLGEIYRGPGEDPVSELTLDNADLPKAFYQLPQIRYLDAMGTTATADRILLVQVIDTEQLILRFDATGQAGQGELKEPATSTPFTFTLLQATATPYTTQWIISTSVYGFLRISATMDTETASHYTGRRTLERWNGAYWAELNSTHWFSLTK